MPKRILVLIDGHSLAFRAFHALPPDLASPAGELTNAVFGFFSMLLNVLRDHDPQYIAVAFDVGRTYRHDMFPGYKAHRERMPDELDRQVERIKEILTALHIPIVTLEGFEADDVLAALARQAEAQDVPSLIVTGDRDILQVVDDNVTVLTSGRRFSDTILYTPLTVYERYQLRPDQLVDYKALIGDKSDEIPGVKGVGEKGALAALRQYETLDNLYAHIDEVTPQRLQTALIEGKADAELSRKLAHIDFDNVPIRLDLDSCRRGAYDRDAVVELFRQLAFRSLVDRLPPNVAPEETVAGVREPSPTGEEEAVDITEGEPAAEDWTLPLGEALPGAEVVPTGQMALFAEEEFELARGDGQAALSVQGKLPAGFEHGGDFLTVQDEETLRRVAESLDGVYEFAFDTETDGLDPHAAQLVGLSVAWERGPEGSAYIPIGHREGQQLPWDLVREALKPAFSRPDVRMVAHNAGFDMAVLQRYGLPVRGQLADTMVGEFLLEPGSRALGLKDIAWTRLRIEMTPIKELIGTGKTRITMDQVPVAVAARYASADAAVTLRLADELLPELREKGLWRLFHEVEMPLTPVLLAMESAGVLLDVPVLQQMSEQLTARMRDLEGQIQQIAGYTFNVNSTQQLSDLLFGKLGLSTQGLKRTQAGAVSTAAGVLDGLRGQHEVVDLILEQRHLAKLLGTYVDALPALINPRTGRVHTSFNQTGAESGRISSSNPNLQNIPVRSEMGREIRRAFIAAPGCKLLSADYSQVELRILAHISQDENLLAAFGRGEDIHASAAAAIYGLPLGAVSKNQRNVAKMMNFATSYGVSAFGLAQRTGLSRNEADQFMQRYFATYPGVRTYLEQTKASAYERGYVETLLGRKRFFPVLNTTARGARTHIARQAAERAAINHPIQGTAADIIKIAMIALHRELQEGGYGARMLLQVHDELVLEVPEAELREVCAIVKRTMEDAYDLDAPLAVDMEAGPNWYEMADI